MSRELEMSHDRAIQCEQTGPDLQSVCSHRMLHPDSGRSRQKEVFGNLPTCVQRNWIKAEMMHTHMAVVIRQVGLFLHGL